MPEMLEMVRNPVAEYFTKPLPIYIQDVPMLEQLLQQCRQGERLLRRIVSDIVMLLHMRNVENLTVKLNMSDLELIYMVIDSTVNPLMRRFLHVSAIDKCYVHSVEATGNDNGTDIPFLQTMPSKLLEEYILHLIAKANENGNPKPLPV
jgi:hypothetical protein